MPNSATDTLQGITAIVVEDNMLVADSTRLLLEALDARVAGLAGTVERGVALVESCEFDVALLDIDLRGRSVMPVVDALQRRERPFVFISGFGADSVLSQELHGIERLDKPVESSQLVAAIRRAVAGD